MKSFPLSELQIVAMLYFAGKDDEGCPDFELEVLDDVARSLAAFETFAGRCDCCGQALKYACEVVHIPTGAGFYVGRSCAAKIECLKRYGSTMENLSVGLAERVACNKREQAFRVSRPDACGALDWAATEQASRIASDMRAKLRRYGSLSDAQAVGCDGAAASLRSVRDRKIAAKLNEVRA